MTKSEIRKLTDKAEAATEELRDALQELYDSRSEKWQESDAGTDLSEAIDEVDNAVSAFATVHGWLDQ